MRTPTRRARALTLTTALALVGACAMPISASAARVADPDTKVSATARSTLGNGLGRLVPGKAGTRSVKDFKLDASKLAIRDAKGRVLVDLTPRAGVDASTFRDAAATAGLDVTAVASERGVLEGFVAPSAITVLAAVDGVGTLVQVPKPQTSAGRVLSQGVAFERIDKVLKKGVDGSGITIGVLSDSFDAATTNAEGDPLTDHAADDVASGDLPGPGNPRNSQPVVVVQDLPKNGISLDEGRGMLQILHDEAPGAKLCFATADLGEVAFSNNIRALADRSGPCRADVIVDDVYYYSEPFFSDGIIGDAVDDVAKQGVQYFSSAGNQGEQQGWESDVHLVGPAAAEQAGLDLSDVDPSLYSGGFQDSDTGRGVDVAQTLTFGEGGGVFDLQWNDPFDLNGASFGEPYFTGTGELTTAGPTADLTFTATPDEVGKVVEFRVDGIPSGSTDVVLSVTAPDGTPLAEGIDTTTSPETFITRLSQAGDYTITVGGYEGSTGPFVASVRPITSPSKTTTDFNALFFSTDGAFLGALADVNQYTGRPSEISPIPAIARNVQLVITRSGTGPTNVSKLQVITDGNLQFTERPQLLAPTIFGHPVAAGAIAVGAQNTFKPYEPEEFTSAGGRLPIYFDSAGNRYPSVQQRVKPEVTAADGVNTTFFVSDSSRDPDDDPNFFGTSAAAPSAAGIAALVLDKRGGGRSVSPSAMRKVLEKATYQHDLDPFSASGSTKGVTVSAYGAQGYERGSIPGNLDDDRFFTLKYRGSGRIRSITFDGATASPTAPGPNGRSAGIVFDTRAFDDEATSGFENLGFPFTVGSISGDRYGSDVKASFSGTSGAAVAGQYRFMTLTFKGGFRSGETLRFGIDRDLAQSAFGDASEGNGADELGGGVFIPQRTVSSNGLKFTATLTNGKRITGYLKNRLGSGYSPVDGYGLIDAEKAVLGR